MIASRRALIGGVAATVAAPCLVPGPSRAADDALIAAASDLRYALDEIAAAHVAVRRSSGAPPINLRITYGSTGNLARQIEQGAPFELFLAADDRI
ncbi:MAG TPA: substrate-binding domain-containing protein, partial [Hyphomicrobiaceae bacterium]|nr:substrate-binding domain-containing protein [Hyphomicrobiaceae bacterium]